MSKLAARIHGFAQRQAADLFFRRPLTIASERPIISFTFDDFPRSALSIGGRILGQAGLRATYYASLGLMGKTSPTGTMFTLDDLRGAVEQGHEIGCHTYDHCDSWMTPSAAFVRSIAANRVAFRQAIPSGEFRSFSYPIRPPRPWSKRAAGESFACCRGSGQTFNAGKSDLNNLRACFLEQTAGDGVFVQQLIDGNREARGWLIFATHDVDNRHTRFGCTPAFFEDVVSRAMSSGAAILPVAEALELVRETAQYAVLAKTSLPSQNRGVSDARTAEIGPLLR